MGLGEGPGEPSFPGRGLGWGGVAGSPTGGTQMGCRWFFAPLLKGAFLMSGSFKKKGLLSLSKRKKGSPGCNIYGPVREFQES